MILADAQARGAVLGGAAFAATAGVLVAGGAPLAAVAVAFVPAALLLLARPKLIVVAAALVLIFSPGLAVATSASLLGYADDAAVAVSLAALALHRLAAGERLRTFPGFGWFAGFAAFGFASAAWNGVDPVVGLEGGFLSTKVVLLGLAVAQVDWGVRDLRAGARVGAGVLWVVVACTAANLVLLGTWAYHFQSWHFIEYRYGLPSLVGPFVHPSVLGDFLCMGAIAVVSYRATLARGLGSLALVIATSAGAFLSLRRVALVGLALGTTLVRLLVARAATLLIALAIVPLIGIGLWGTIRSTTSATYESYIVDRNAAARSLLTMDSVAVANEHFPLGAGFGRYGSYMAGVHYSPEYVRLGFNRVYGLEPGSKTGSGAYLTDTAWPAIIGEGGYLGAVCFVIGLVRVFGVFRQARKAEAASLRWAGLTGIGWFSTMLLASVADPVFTSASLLPTVLPLAAMCSVVMGRVTAEADTYPLDAGGVAALSPVAHGSVSS